MRLKSYEDKINKITQSDQETIFLIKNITAKPIKKDPQTIRGKGKKLIIETKPWNKQNLQGETKDGQWDIYIPLREEKKCKSRLYILTKKTINYQLHTWLICGHQNNLEKITVTLHPIVNSTTYEITKISLKCRYLVQGNTQKMVKRDFQQTWKSFKMLWLSHRHQQNIINSPIGNTIQMKKHTLNKYET